MLGIVRRFSTKAVTKKQMFFDTATLRAVGGTGGRGVSSFQMIQPGKYTPTGGNGGKGGDVYIRVNEQLDALSFPKLVYKAENGHNGKGKCMHGRGGRDLYIDVPVGTLVYKIKQNNSISKEDAESRRSFEQQMYAHFGKEYDVIKESDTSESDESSSSSSEIEKELIFDSTFAPPSKLFCVAQGGKGGEGNREWYERTKKQNLRNWGSNRDRRLQASYYRHDENHNAGKEGEDVSILLEMQQLAQIGLVGYPNAGKSTLLSRLSKTKPKIAAYPFTTLKPLVGYVEYSDGSTLTVADIPGIISGAHANRGLGLSFLRHIQRTSVLAYVIDVSDKENLPNEVYREIQKELLYYDESLLRKNTVVIANKIDVEGSKEGLKLLQSCTKLPIIPISASCNYNIEAVANILKSACFFTDNESKLSF